MYNITNEELITNSFYITYVFLMTTATITFIEAIRTKESKIRHIMNLETCISVVAAFFYGNFTESLKEGVDYEKLNATRYVDWAITTPIMLLVLVLAILYNNKKGAMKFSNYLIILFFNYVMLGFGYAGEVGWMQKEWANVIGFGGFASLYYFIYKKYIAGKNNKDNNLLFTAFIILWALYGVVYMLDETTRNVGYNVLDLFSKCFVGIYFWAYFTNIFK